VPDPNIRLAIDSDLSALVGAFQQARYFTDRFARQQRGRGALLVAWQGSELVGNVYLWWEPAEEAEVRRWLPGVPLLTHLEVRRPYRNQGIGTGLIAEAERILHQRGHRQVALGVGVLNQDAQRLYTRLDYVEWRHPAVRTERDTFQIFVKPLAGASVARRRHATE
jgi:GNAT superfamily N-acetyltransferase